ncbi:efflux RND transporter periplasmic adaptor subunit [Lysinimonas soli]|uniref:Efflux RND transporter periplasmic adaptor subunit n=1 Tax=Lysinimonas soli TaxID=1074233 RepID=A0ABW0NS88_9MICO
MRQRASQTHGGASRVRRWTVGAAVAALLVTGGGLAGAYAIGSSTAAPAQKKVDAATARIERGTLSGTTKASGTLEYADAHDVNAGLGGVITSLPAAGAQIGLGQQLYAVDNVPVYLFHGSLPVWRSFQPGMADGPDVKQLEDDLATLGYFSGNADGTFTWATSNAIKKWQRATGQVVTGSIEPGRIVFQPTDVRVSTLDASVGSNAGPGVPVLSLTGLDKQVKVNVRLSDQALAKVGGKVSIDLPDGSSTAGVIASVGVPTEVDDATGQKSVMIPVVVALDDPAAAGDLQQASVTVDFPSETRENVLSVPIDALLAISASTFGVEIVNANGTTRRVPVKTGLFAGGRVEVSGDGISAGQNVVVPAA